MAFSRNTISLMTLQLPRGAAPLLRGGLDQENVYWLGKITSAIYHG